MRYERGKGDRGGGRVEKPSYETQGGENKRWSENKSAVVGQATKPISEIAGRSVVLATSPSLTPEQDIATRCTLLPNPHDAYGVLPGKTWTTERS